MKVDVWCQTDTGLRRETNQDSFLINRELGLFVVADGMGGHSGGEVASAMAVKAVEDVVKADRNKANPFDLLQSAYREASRRIFDKATESPNLSGMGTTMVVGYIHKKSLYLANVGDSRAYLYRKPYFWQLTEDHSSINEQMRATGMTEDQAKKLVGRNVITRSVGFERDIEVDILERAIQSDEGYILCSDGLCGLVDDADVQKIMNSSRKDQIVEKCIKKALDNGGHDNVTVMYVQFG